MAYKEQDVVLTTKDASGNTVIQMPITRAANVEDLKSTCLPLSGGAILKGFVSMGSGDASRFQSSTDDNYTVWLGGSGYSKGGRITLYGYQHATNAGKVAIGVTDGTNEKTLWLSPDGGVSWNGNAILTSAGGTITGNIIINRESGHIYKQDANGRMLIRGGTGSGTDGASLYLNGEGYSSNGGCFILKTAKGDTASEFYGRYDGMLKWANKNIVRSVNGQNADDSGNVAITAQSLGAHTYDLTDRVTTLFSNTSGQGSGDITLSQAYTNFKALCIVYGSDASKEELYSTIVSVWELQKRKSIGTASFALFMEYYYWIANSSSSTTTKFVNKSENCRVYYIYGIK